MLMGIIATRSLDKQVTGLKDLVAEHEERIRTGIQAYDAAQQVCRPGIAVLTTLEPVQCGQG